MNARIYDDTMRNTQYEVWLLNNETARLDGVLEERGEKQSCKRFSVGRESTEDDQRPGRLVTVSGVETVTKINQIVRADRRMSIRMNVKAVNSDKETVRKILHEELRMTKVCAKLVSKNLTPDQKLLRQQVCSDFLERLK
ncbi:putative mariner transposase [Trichonephila clavipes]|nr:putative mariner transposase [Trichonephila clavipes]